MNRQDKQDENTLRLCIVLRAMKSGVRSDIIQTLAICALSLKFSVWENPRAFFSDSIWSSNERETHSNVKYNMFVFHIHRLPKTIIISGYLI